MGKEKLNEYKFVVAAVDSVLNTNDPVKTAVAHAGLYTSIYAVILASNVFASRPFTDEQEGRFHDCCAKVVGCQAQVCQFLSSTTALKADSPYRFLTFALPTLAATAYIGKKVSMATIIWLVLIVQCATMVPQVQQKFKEVTDKVKGLIQKKKD